MFFKSSLSRPTRLNWQIDAVLFLSAITAALSGVYFLFLPSGGYQGGRNPFYGVTILFDRHTWDLLHTWSGVAMILAVLVHFAIHWKWVTAMTRRIFNEMLGRCACLNRHGHFNVFIDALIALSFLLTALSGLYFLFLPGGSHRSAEVTLFFSPTTWDLIHTWAGVVLILSALIHFAIHWQWVTKVTRRYFSRSPRQPLSQPASQTSGAR